jgi:hypothetical protein
MTLVARCRPKEDDPARPGDFDQPPDSLVDLLLGTTRPAFIEALVSAARLCICAF